MDFQKISLKKKPINAIAIVCCSNLFCPALDPLLHLTVKRRKQIKPKTVIKFSDVFVIHTSSRAGLCSMCVKSQKTSESEGVDFAGNASIELFRLLAGFLATSKLNSFMVKVCGKQTRKVGLVVTGSFQARETEESSRRDGKENQKN